MVENNKIQPANFELSAVKAKEAFLAVADEKTWIEEIGFTLQILRGSASSFKACDQESIRNAVTNVALSGSTLNPVLHRCYLIPRKIKGVLKCCLEFDYRGLIHIAVNSGSVLTMDATVVYANDHFYYEKGLNPVLEHRPVINGEPGEQIGVYAIADLHHGLKQFVYLPWAEVLKVQKFAKSEKSFMWNDWIDEAAKKTAIKKLYKYLPQTDQMSVAVVATNEAEGFDFQQRDKREQGKEIMERFTEPEVKELPEGEKEESTEDLGDVPSDATIVFEKMLMEVKTLDKLKMVWAEYELTKPNKKDHDVMAELYDMRAKELK